MDCLAAVSYTHLDVYKRQVPCVHSCSEEKISCLRGKRVLPWSYRPSGTRPLQTIGVPFFQLYSHRLDIAKSAIDVADIFGYLGSYFEIVRT